MTLATAFLVFGIALATHATAATDIRPLPGIDEVKAFFETVHGRQCASAQGDVDLAGFDPPSWELSFNYASDALDTPPYTQVLYQFPCIADDDNAGYVYILAGEREGLRTASFPQPELSVAYQDPDAPENVESIAISGYSATDVVFNPSFDPQMRTLSEHTVWQSDGSASATATWRLVETRFVLVTYSVDASYNGVADPQVLIDLAGS